jgi:hypothetical protein
MAQLKPMRLGVSKWFHNKQNNAPLRFSKQKGEDSNQWAFGAFETALMTTAQIAAHVTSGKAICVAACQKNWRKEDNFISAQLMGVDFDHGVGVRDLVAHEFIANHAFLIYATPSSTPQNPRSRVLFTLDMPIENLAEYKKFVKRLLLHLDIGDADEQCKDGVRIFYGSETKEYSLVSDAVLPVAVLEALPPHPDELPKPEPVIRRKEVDTSDPDMQKRLEAYARKVIDNELNALATVPNGMDLRHGAINGAVMRLIGYAKGGWAGFENIENEIRAIGRQWGRSDQEVEASLKGAWVKATPVPVGLPDDPPAKKNGTHEPSHSQQSPEPPPIPPSLTWRTSDESMARFRERLDRPVNGAHVPLIFPFKCLREKFGGFCMAVPPGVLIGIVGLSGGMKTSFIETITDIWRQLGENDVLWWGPEWSWEKMADRAVQRYSEPNKPTAGVQDMMLHEMWLAEEASGIPSAQRYGKQLSEALKKNSRDISQSIESWAGKCHYIEQMDIEIDPLFTAAKERLEQARAMGRNIRIAVFDYVQLMEMRSVRTEGERINAVLGRIKAFCVENKLIGIVASQVTKSSSSAVREGSETLKAESGQFFRSDKFNLILTLNPQYDGTMMKNYGVIGVVKNSAGRTGEQSVFIDPARFKWLDKEAIVKTQHVNAVINGEGIEF